MCNIWQGNTMLMFTTNIVCCFPCQFGFLKRDSATSGELVPVCPRYPSFVPDSFRDFRGQVGMVKSDLCRLVMMYSFGGFYFDTVPWQWRGSAAGISMFARKATKKLPKCVVFCLPRKDDMQRELMTCVFLFP